MLNIAGMVVQFQGILKIMEEKNAKNLFFLTVCKGYLQFPPISFYKGTSPV